jgi:hypothetical protein
VKDESIVEFLTKYPNAKLIEGVPYRPDLGRKTKEKAATKQEKVQFTSHPSKGQDYNDAYSFIVENNLIAGAIGLALWTAIIAFVCLRWASRKKKKYLLKKNAVNKNTTPNLETVKIRVMNHLRFKRIGKGLAIIVLLAILYLFALNGRYERLNEKLVFDKWKKEIIRVRSAELPVKENGKILK